MMWSPDEQGFIEAVWAAPGDDLPRLVYADYLDERDDPRGAYLRAELEAWNRKAPDHRWVGADEFELIKLAGTLDQVWVKAVSRPWLGILFSDITFAEPGPPVTLAFLKQIEAKFNHPLPPDYAAFLLRHNGGRPDRCLCTYVNPNDPETWYHDTVRFFSTADRAENGEPILTLQALDLFVATDYYELPLLLIGEVHGDDHELRPGPDYLALIMAPEQKYETIVRMEHDEEGILTRLDQDFGSFQELLSELDPWPDD